MPYDGGKDPYYSGGESLYGQGRKMVAVTPSDDTDLATYAKGLLIKGAGNIEFLPAMNDDADTVVMTVTDNYLLVACVVRRVLATNTTATGIYAITD